MSDDNIEKILAEEGVLDTNTAAESVQNVLDSLTVSNDMQCSKCRNTCHKICPTCKGAFCDDHTSIIDPKFCNLCLGERALELQSQPLTSPDGVQHSGRELKPTGPEFGTLAKRIADMTDFQLESHIQYYQDLVHQAERSLDIRRVILGAAQIESSQRKDAQRRHLRAAGIKIKSPSGATVQGGAKAAKPKVDTTAGIGQALGLSPDALAAVLGLLTKKK